MSRWMKAWRLDRLGGALALKEVPVPEPRPGSVLVRMQAVGLLSYLRAYVEGNLPQYNPPKQEFTIGTNGVGVVEVVGRDVWSLKSGRRVALSPHFVARENVDDPAQALIGLTAGAGSDAMLADWPDGTLAEYALVPVEAATPLDGLEDRDPAELAVLGRFMVPFGGLLRARRSSSPARPAPSAPPPFFSPGRSAQGGSSPRDGMKRRSPKSPALAAAASSPSP